MLRIVVVAAVASAGVACASSGVVYTPRPFPVPGGGPTAPAPAPPPATTPPPAVPSGGELTAIGYGVSGTALSLRGAPYRDGGEDPSGFDCSGFVQYVFAQNGVRVPREVKDQYRAGRQVRTDHLEPGDLVFFSTVAPGASHVGIIVGGDQFVHAPSERGVVRVEHLSTPYWSSRLVGARRMD